MNSALGFSFRSARLRALLSLLLGIAAGLVLMFPAQHGCRSAVVAARRAEHRHDGHGRHQMPDAPASPDCACVGDACGPSLAAPRSAPVLAVAPLAAVVVAPVAFLAERPSADRAHVLPFANGPPASHLA